MAVNTWGDKWGEKGLFKILRGENECDIETFVVAAWARPANKASYRNDNPLPNSAAPTKSFGQLEFIFVPNYRKNSSGSVKFANKPNNDC